MQWDFTAQRFDDEMSRPPLPAMLLCVHPQMLVWGRGHSHICSDTSLLSEWILFNKLNRKCLRVQQWDCTPARFGRGKTEDKHPFGFLWQPWQMCLYKAALFPWNVRHTEQSSEKLWGHSCIPCRFLILGGSSSPLLYGKKPPLFQWLGSTSLV